MKTDFKITEARGHFKRHFMAFLFCLVVLNVHFIYNRKTIGLNWEGHWEGGNKR